MFLIKVIKVFVIVLDKFDQLILEVTQHVQIDAAERARDAF
jgi:hypothetical protein